MKAILVTCDRCGKAADVPSDSYLPEHWSSLRFEGARLEFLIEKEICGDCTKEIKALLGSLKKDATS